MEGRGKEVPLYHYQGSKVLLELKSMGIKIELVTSGLYEKHGLKYYQPSEPWIWEIKSIL